jgi:DNA (cytosine-5)-methyltransferase 1
VDNAKNINILSLCTGYGGFELALERVFSGHNLRVVACEIEAYASANLVAKAEQGRMSIEAVFSNIKTFPARRFFGCFDIITAGYPCQPFSAAGQRKGTEDPRHLWPYVADIITEVSPACVLLENVSGHLSLGFDTVLRDLLGLGYDVEAGLFTASEVGAPHRRQRLFIVANRKDIGCRGWTDSNGISERFIQKQEKGKRDNTWCETSRCDRDIRREELADTEGKRIQGNRPEGKQESEVQVGQEISGRDSRRTLWPARPGQHQYDWEEPRTTQRRLGRTTDGTAYRVDRLRLLGNGIVPAQAELAIRTLIKL